MEIDALWESLIPTTEESINFCCPDMDDDFINFTNHGYSTKVEIPMVIDADPPFDGSVINILFRLWASNIKEAAKKR